MKILVYGDVHFSQYSSIIRSHGEKYSIRLENLIKSVNWAEKLAHNNCCDLIVGLGDFFDTATLNSMELTALKDVVWAFDIPHKFLIGNHEIGMKDLQISSAHFLNMVPDIQIIDKPTVQMVGRDQLELELCYLPYIFEEDRKHINDYLGEKVSKKRIIFSHNDLKGIQLGGFISNSGFDIEDIENNCDLFINGHLHNGSKISSKIINCGNLTGQNFGEDAFKYDHVALIIDTDTFSIEVYENPFAFNFYKVSFVNDYNLFDFDFKDNAVMSIVCNEHNVEEIRKDVEKNSKIIAYKITVERNVEQHTEIEDINLSVDHLKMFGDFILTNMGKSDIVISELTEVCR